MALYTQARRRGQMLSNRRRNVTGGPVPVPGQTPPIIRPQTPTPPRPVPTGTNAQGYDPIHYGMNNQKIGYAKVGQARNQGGVPAPAPAPAGNMGHLAQLLSQGIIPDRFGGSFAIGPNGGILDNSVGVQGAVHDARYQKLYNAAKAAGLSITGDKGYGGAYDPTILYARGGNHAGFVDMRTGITNPTSTGASATSEGSISPEVLARLRAKAGYNEDAARASAAYLGVQDRYPYIPVGGGPRNTPLEGGGASSSSQWQLGSDGQYHDINQPLPPGVTLKPPAGATAPQTQPVSAIAEAAHGTPQAAINAGKDPTKHQAYWADKGWVYNDATDQWTNKNAPAPVPGQTPPINMPGTVPGGGGLPTNQDGSVQYPMQAGAAAPTMPLDPAYIAAQRAAQLQLNSTLQGTNPALEQINAQNNLALARMNTNQGYDTQALMEALSSRGALQSSIYGTERGNLATNYLRTGQDLAADVANAQSQVYQQQQGAYNDYYASLIEALLSSAASSATSQYTPVGRPNRKPKKKPKKKRGNNRGGS